MANSVDPDQTAPIGAVCSGSTLFASILNSSVMLGNYLQQTTSADDIFRCVFFVALLRLMVFFVYNFFYLIYAICKQASIFCQWSAVSHSVEHQIGKKVASSSLTQVTVLCHLSKTLFPLLSTGSNQEDRKHPDMTEQEMS